MYTEQHREEALSWAHIRAVAGKAGVALSIPDFDYGVDGSFHLIKRTSYGLVPSAIPLDFQLKSSRNIELKGANVVYDLEVRTYNYLIDPEIRGPSPCLLLLKMMPPDETQWLINSETELVLGGGCYWQILRGQSSSNRKTVRIQIPRHRLFTPEVLTELLLKRERREPL